MNPPILIYPDCTKPFILSTDASLQGIGMILSQEHDKRESVIAYASRSLSSKGKRIIVLTEIEALALVEGIKYFQTLLCMVKNSQLSLIIQH